MSFHEGDSIAALAAGKQQLKVRLDGIDALELKQPFSTQAKAALSGLVFSLHIKGRDRYKRTLAVVVAAGVNVNRELVRLADARLTETTLTPSRIGRIVYL